jgi:catalase
MNADEKALLIANIVGHMKAVKKEEIKRRQVDLFRKCDPDYGNRVAAGLGLTVSVK